MRDENIESIIKKLNDGQKEEVVNALLKIDSIFEKIVADLDAEDDDNYFDVFLEDYHSSLFYEGMYTIMEDLGQWC